MGGAAGRVWTHGEPQVAAPNAPNRRSTWSFRSHGAAEEEDEIAWSALAVWRRTAWGTTVFDRTTRSAGSASVDPAAEPLKITHAHTHARTTMATVTTTLPPATATAEKPVVSDLKYVPGKGFKMIPRDKDYKKPGLNWYGAVPRTHTRARVCASMADVFPFCKRPGLRAANGARGSAGCTSTF